MHSYSKIWGKCVLLAFQVGFDRKMDCTFLVQKISNFGNTVCEDNGKHFFFCTPNAKVNKLMTKWTNMICLNVTFIGCKMKQTPNVILLLTQDPRILKARHTKFLLASLILWLVHHLSRINKFDWLKLTHQSCFHNVLQRHTSFEFVDLS